MAIRELSSQEVQNVSGGTFCLLTSLFSLFRSSCYTPAPVSCAPAPKPSCTPAPSPCAPAPQFSCQPSSGCGLRY